VRKWFREALGEPTAAERQGWPSIQAGQNTLILAPTGSGKTLAAFLACLDALRRQNPVPPGVRVFYVSPLNSRRPMLLRVAKVAMPPPRILDL
jgi:ATP-dependent Lhr-like helicase